MCDTMQTVNNIFLYINSLAPTETKAEWDNCGILVGDKNKEISRVLLSLDITDEVVTEAKEIGAQLIISHHPVIFSPLKNVQSDSVVYKLIESGIGAVCMHTNLDLAQQCGVNACLAKALELSEIKLLDGEFIAVGKTEKPFTPQQFAENVKQKLSCKGLRYTNKCDSIKTVAVSSGGGGESIFKSASLCVDAFVTGEIKHHEILFANKAGVSVFDVGHFKSEDVVIEPLRELLSEKFSDVEFIKSQKFDDGIIYA